MADTDQAPAAPDDNYGVQAPTYVTSNGDGTHQVVVNGQLQTIATSQLPNAVLPDAIAAVNTNQSSGGFNPDAAVANVASGVGNAISGFGQGVGNFISGQPLSAADTTPAPAPAPTPATNTQPPATDNQPQPAPAQPAPDQAAPTQAPVRTGGGGSADVRLATQAEQKGEQAAKIQQDIDRAAAADQLKEATPYYQQEDQRQAAQLQDIKQQQDQEAQLMQKRIANASAHETEKLELPKHSLGQQLLSGLGIILGGIGGGIQGRGNPVLDQMQQRTQQFIDIQKYNMDHGFKVDDLYHNIYQDQRQLGADDEHAKALADNIYKARLANTLSLHALAHGNQAASVAFLNNMKALQSGLADQNSRIQQSVASTNLTNQQAVGAGLQNVKSRIEIGDLGFARSAQQKMQAGQSFARLTPDERRVTYQQAAGEGRLLNDGVALIKPQPDDLKQRYATDAASDALHNLTAAVEEAKQNPLKSVNPWADVHGKAAAAIAQLRATMPAMWGGAGGSGLSPKEAEVWEDAISKDPTKFLTEFEGRREGLLAAIHSSHKQFNKHFQVQQFAPTPES